MSLRELFRKKLDNVEVIPSASVRTNLMRKVAVREFLRFDPVRLNIYYAGGILAAGIVAAIMLFPEETASGKVFLPDDSAVHTNIISSVDSGLMSEEILIPEADSFAEHELLQASESAGIETVIGEKAVTAKNNTSRERISVSPAGLNESISEKNFFIDSSKDNNMLKSMYEADKQIFESSVSEGCTPLRIQFFNRVSDYDSCRWVFGDGGSLYKSDPEWIFDVEGEYRVSLEVFKANSLIASSSQVIIVHPKPSARFEIYPEKAIIPDDEIRFVNYSTDAVRYKWDFGDGNSSDLFEPVHRYSEFGNYNVSLVVSSEYGCTDSLLVINAFGGSGYFIDFPNAFIPNPEGSSGGLYSAKSDETAQVFHPSFSGVSEYQLKVFSKLGILIFESNDINIGWDGYFNGQLSKPGVYIWKVRGSFINGEPFIKMGDLTLISK